MQLRWYQEEAINSLYEYFMSNSGNPVIGLPTGSGKTHIPTVFIQRVMQAWPNQRFLMLTHIKELIDQAYKTMLSVWPNAPIGIYSAGLGRKEFALPIVFAGIQSAVKNPMLFGHRDIIFVDEVHMVNQDENSMYQNFLACMKLINPHVKFIGLSATLYRMGQGHLIDGGLFTDVCYDMTDTEGFNQLIAEGFLCPLVPHRTKIELDVTNVAFSKGDFIISQLEKKVDINEVTHAALSEAIVAGRDRKSWLIFASGIDHSNHISEQLEQFGIDCASVHSKQSSEYNDKAIRAFKNYDIQALTSYSKLTTGFDHAGIDLIIDLRPTMSVPLHVQKYGRGTRPVYAKGYNLEIMNERLEAIRVGPKQNCKVLDFSKNVPRLGFVNDPIIPKKKGSGNGQIPIKLCNACGVYHHIKAKVCMSCGAEFSFEIKITKNAGHHELIKSDLPIVETFDVDRVIYQKIAKEGKIPYVRSTYYCGLRAFTENIFPEHPKSLTRHKFHEWWKQRHRSLPPSTVDDVLNLNAELRKPARIRIWLNKSPYPEILGAEY